MHNGIAIALAWPETLCKQAGAWYDIPLKWLNINKNRYYKVGHAAVILIENKTGTCYFFDFGRYHAPHKHGRVRGAKTDHDLEIKTKAIVSDGKIINYEELLLELSNNESTHGNGPLHASYCNINFEKAFSTSMQMQSKSPIPYGPFLPYGTNCSRFVNTIVLSGNPHFVYSLFLKYPLTLSPTPLGNIKALSNYYVVYKDEVYTKTLDTNYQSFKPIINDSTRHAS